MAEIYIDGKSFDVIDVEQWEGMSEPPVAPLDTARIFYSSITDKLRLSENVGEYQDLAGLTTLDTRYLKLDASNDPLTGDLDLGAYNLTTTGLGTFGSLVVDSPTLAVNVAGYTDKIGFGTATPANTWEFSDSTPGGTFAGIGMLLRNPTDVSASPTFRLSPALILSAQGKGATNQQYQWAQYITPSGSADSLTFKYAYKFGAGSWTDYPFYMDIANGFMISCSGVGETIKVVPKVFYLVNSTAATSSLDQYTGPITWYSQGWKTQATAASQYMAMSQLNAPEQGVISPIGVHKWMYGINTNIPVEANELMRLQWGSDAGVTGVFFNKRSLASYTFNVTGLPVYANNAAAVAGGLAVGSFYRTGGDPDTVCVVH
jgi:hypothetical protein